LAILVALYAAATSLALLGFGEISSGLQRTQARVDGLRVALDLARAVRDQYAHQAHTIIIGNDSHLGFYAEAKGRVRDRIEEMRRSVERADERAWIDEIQAGAAELDQIFTSKIVPAVLAGNTADAHDEHARALAVVSRIEDRTDLLSKRFEEAVGELHAFVDGTRRRAVRWSLLFLGLAPLLALLVVVYIARKVTRPVALLQAGAERLASGDLDTRIRIDSRDELGALARQFNAMAAALKQHQDELILSERLAAVGRLASGVAHEINNPLGVILGYTRLLRKKAEGELAEDLAVIEDETLRCKEIVEGLLDLARPTQAGHEPVDLRALADDLVARASETQSTPGVAIRVAGQGTALGAAAKLRQVLLNLIKNAVEAAAPTGQVRIDVGERDGQVEVLVSDTGPGLAADVRERLFEPFFTTKRSGTGLGLAVSRSIARAHGGDLLADTPAEGACFVLRLPRPQGEAR
jgi:signal transduction histidine kinase